ncbi:MAG: penicillin-binding protein 2 [Actinomycetota bacterium]
MSDNSRVRVSIVGVVIVALFSALLARLWFLQIGAEEEFKIEAVSRATRIVQSETPRGSIYDRNGLPLVENRASWAITVDRALEPETRRVVLGQVAEILGEPYTAELLEENFNDVRQSPLKPAIVAADVAPTQRVVILENTEDYPGVHVEKLTVRNYSPEALLMPHVLGYVGEISEEQLAEHRDDGYVEGDTIGRAGVERAYEAELRGEPRREQVEVDPRGQIVGTPIDVDPGTVGNDVYLTLDANWQRAAVDALQQGIDGARLQRNDNVGERFETFRAPAGAVVAMDASTGEVVAMASFPTYDPRTFIDGISQVEWALLTEGAGPKPLLNYATQGEYLPGSSFKLVTATALTRYGIRGHSQPYQDRGFVEIRGTDYENAGRRALGQVALARALTVSSDTYFYTAGFAFWERWKGGDVESGLGLQAVAREFGFGENTGIELDERAGRVPDPDWKRDFATSVYESERAQQENSIWYPADNILMAIGQGDMIASPLQLANAYAAFANDGTLWKPHVGRDVRDAEHERVLRAVAPESLRTIEFDPATRQQMLNGFAGATASDSGTAAAAFAGFPFDQVPVSGKTGTAQVKDKGDTSVFAAYFPANGTQYVVVALVEEAGRGANVAAPIARHVIEVIVGLPSAATITIGDSGQD